MNNKNKFAHVTDVFAFTFKQGRTGKSYAFMAYVMPFIFLAIFFCVSYLPGVFSQKIDYNCEKVIVLDETGTGQFAAYMQNVLAEDPKDTPLKKLKVENSTETDVDKVTKSLSEEETHTVLVKAVIDKEKPSMSVKLYRPEWSEVSGDEAKEILDAATSTMSIMKAITGDIDQESLMIMVSGADVSVTVAGDDKPEESLATMLVKTLAPMIVIMVIYFMVIIYGQSTAKIVAAEKNSRLMEMLLTSIQPEALILGKVLAQSALAIMQMLLWAAGGVVGFILGDVVAKNTLTEYVNPAKDILKVLQEGGSALSASAIIISVLALIFGFLLYSFIAGVFGSFVGKPEELSSYMGMYNIIVIIGFFGSYFVLMGENEMIKTVVNLVPITSAFGLPGNALVGSCSLMIGLIGLALLILSCLILAFVSGRIYKSKVFNNGKSRVPEFLKFLR